MEHHLSSQHKKMMLKDNCISFLQGRFHYIYRSYLLKHEEMTFLLRVMYFIDRKVYLYILPLKEVDEIFEFRLKFWSCYARDTVVTFLGRTADLRNRSSNRYTVVHMKCVFELFHNPEEIKCNVIF